MFSYARVLPGWPSGLRPGLLRPDAPPRGVAVTVCGIADSASTWSRLHRALVDDGLAVLPIVWNPFGQSLEELTNRVVAAADAARGQADTDRLHLIGHSLGGVMARRAVQHGALHGKVESVSTLASPHRGTPVARLARRWFSLAAELDRLATRVDAGDRDPAGAAWTAVIDVQDLIVPAGRQALTEIPGARNVRVAGTDHVGILRHERAIAAVVAATTPETNDTSLASETLAA